MIKMNWNLDISSNNHNIKFQTYTTVLDKKVKQHKPNNIELSAASYFDAFRL